MEILIAEDEIIFQTILLRSLEKWGYTVIRTTNGQEAYSALMQDDAPQIALLDWMMPEMDGLTLCKKLRDSQRNNPLYLILLTHRDEPTDIVQGLDAGADDYVVKPLRPDELRGT